MNRKKSKTGIGIFNRESFACHLEPNYHYEKAIQLFNSATQLHNEGRIYKSLVQKLFFLEDDYNDNLRHFVLGLERFRVNTGTIKLKIEKLDALREESRLYKYESYHPIRK